MITSPLVKPTRSLAGLRRVRPIPPPDVDLGDIPWSSYWATHFISALTALTTSDTEQTITATIVGTGYDGVSYEYSLNGLTVWAEHGTSANGIYNATGLTAGTLYYWRARLYKGTNYGAYSDIADAYTTIDTILADGHTVAFFDHSDLATITKDASEHVSRWNDKLASGNDLSVVGGTPHWSADGILFDGADDYLKTAAIAALDQPTYIYMVVKQVTWTEYDFLWDGHTSQKGLSYQYSTVVGEEPSLIAHAGTLSPENADIELSQWVILRVLFKGAGSKIQINEAPAKTWNSGANNMGGFTLATIADHSGNFANIQVKDIILRSDDDSAGANETAIYHYLKYKNFIWRDKGTVLSATIAAELDNVLEPTVIYEGNAQILSTTGNIFKMCFTGGWGNVDTYYAESLDGVTWTKHPTAIVEDAIRNFLIKVGLTYYLYVNRGDAAIDLYTSSNGLDFTLDTADVLVKGTGVQWDVTAIANLSIIIEAGTWYMFYDGVKTGSDYWKVGLATSADGRTWTKYGSNPVINSTETVGGTDVHKIGTDYYMWVHATHKTVVPTELYRYKSTDLTTWALDTTDITFARVTTDEGVGTQVGQVGDPCLLEVNSKVYLFYCAGTDGTQQSGAFHIKLAVADMPFTDLVNTKEGNA